MDLELNSLSGQAQYSSVADPMDLELLPVSGSGITGVVPDPVPDA